MHSIHSDSPTDADPLMPGDRCGPDCALFEDPEAGLGLAAELGDGHAADCGAACMPDDPAYAGRCDCICHEPDPEGDMVASLQAQAELGESLVDALDSFLEAAELLAVELHRRHSVEAVRHFNAYHMADLEGAGAGWLGRGLLIDAARALRSGKES